MTFIGVRHMMSVVVLGALLGACSEDGDLRDFQQVSLRVFGYWGGSFEWEAPREALTPAQAEALAGLEVIRGNKDCPQDITEYALTTVDAEGQERRLVTNELNAPCGRDEQLDFESLKPLLDTLSCVATGAAATTLSAAQTIQAGDGCRHGFFSYEGEPPHWVKVTPAAEGGPHTFSLRHCGGKTTALELFDATGTTRLAQSQADGSSATQCPTLSAPLEAGKQYALRVTSQAVSVGGHVLLEVRPD